MKKQTIWIKKGHDDDDGDGYKDLFVFTGSKTIDFMDSVEIISSCNFPALQGLGFGDVVEVEIKVKGRKQGCPSYTN